MKTRLYSIAILAALAVTAVAQQPTPARTWAVVIGISKYQKLPGGQQLQFADRDAVLFADSIQKRGVASQNVKVLIGADATSASIKSAIGNWLARAASQSDTVLIFFSGHGLFEREFGESYLLGYDSDPKDPYGTALSISELGQALGRRVHSSHVLVIADAVRRDFFDPETNQGATKSFEQAFEALAASRPGLSSILASGPEEFSREGQRWNGHGVFTKHLADVLIDGGSPNGNVALTTDELFALLKSRVAEDSANKQHPWRAGATLAEISAPLRPTTESVKSETRVTPQNAQPKTEVATKAPATPVVTPSPTNQPPPESKPNRETKTVESTKASSEKTERVASSADGSKPQPPGVVKSNASEKKAEPRAVAVPEPAAGSGEKLARNAESKPAVNSNNAPPIRAKSSPMPPATESIHTTQPGTSPPPGVGRPEVTAAGIPEAPKPIIVPPSAVTVSADRASAQPESVSASIPITRPDAAPTPLVLQLEAAIASKNLIEPKNSSAWDIYQSLAREPSATSDLARLKWVLAEALTVQGRAIVTGDVRSDNVSDKVDEFKRAGLMLARARTLTPENSDVISFEKLSAAEALIALQFYDEAERALGQLQSGKTAAVENALGLVHLGKLDTFRADRAFKRAIELDPKWATPHYNLALLYRSQQKQESLAELESAAALDKNSVSLLTALGEEYFARQQWKQAAETYRKAVALKPADDNLHTKLGHALYSQGLQDEANREYQKARELRGKQP